MEVRQSYDLAVIGGGPAGCAAAIHVARQGHRVLLLERGSFPRQKVCGEFVSAESLDLLDHLLISDFKWPNPPPRISRSRIFMGGRIIETVIDPPASSIPRFAMDAALWESAKDVGITALEKTPVLAMNGNGGFQVETPQSLYSIRAVIDASGRWSNLTRPETAVSESANIGLKRHYRELSPSLSVDLYFFPGGYCGVQPVSDAEINVSALVSPKFAKTLEDVFRLDPRLEARSRDWQPATEAVATFPLIFKPPKPVASGRPVLNVGDAAGFIDPFVGDGISMAFHSGAMAAEAISLFLGNSISLERAADQYRNTYERQLMPAFRNAARLRKLLGAPILRDIALGLLSVPAISGLALRCTRARTA